MVRRASVRVLFGLLAAGAFGCTGLPAHPKLLDAGGTGPGESDGPRADGAPGADAAGDGARPPGDGSATGDGAAQPGADGSAPAGDGAPPSADAAPGGADAPVTDAPAPADVTPAGDSACGPGTHLCGSSCAADDDPATCGTRCAACDQPTGGTVSCDGTKCVPSCPAGKQVCMGACIDLAMSCSGSCPSGTRACPDTFCRANDVGACGATCAACPAPANGMATCNGTACDFGCNSGYKKCGTSCILENHCCTPADCTPPANARATCTGGSCGYECSGGYHDCTGACASNTDVATCGTRCAPCDQPTGGSVTCDGTMCVPACPGGKMNCQGACIDVGMACSGTCPGTARACPDGFCKPNDTAACGPTCLACSAPAHATPLCDLTKCDFQCDGGYKKCGPVCIVDSTCCTPADCPTPSNGMATCNGGTCDFTCNGPAYKKCGTVCIASASCCVDADCTPPANSVPVCGGGTCDFTCNAPSWKRCGPVCIASSSCCMAADCTAPGNATAACNMGSCSWTCNGGYKQCGAACIPVGTCCNESTAIDVDRNAVSDCSENLVTNGQFVSEIPPWAPGSNATAVWGGSDAEGAAGSGCGDVTNTYALGAASVTGATQCVPVAPSTLYTIFGYFLIPPAQGIAGNASVQATTYASTDCSGSISSGGVFNSPSWGSATGAWFLRFYSFTTTSDARSARVRLNSTKPGNTGPFTVRYDDALVRPGGICPGLNEAVDLNANGFPDCFESRVKNSQFHTDATQWRLGGGSQIAWNASDADGSGSSGSGNVTNAVTAASFTGVYQCVPVAAATAYQFMVRYYMPSGQGTTGTAGLAGRSFATPDCSGAATKIEYSPVGSTTDAWTTISWSYTTDAGAQSAWFLTGVSKNGAPNFSVRYDDVLVH
jgi:hypothetical protein